MAYQSISRFIRPTAASRHWLLYVTHLQLSDRRSYRFLGHICISCLPSACDMQTDSNLSRWCEIVGPSCFLNISWYLHIWTSQVRPRVTCMNFLDLYIYIYIFRARTDLVISFKTFISNGEHWQSTGRRPEIPVPSKVVKHLGRLLALIRTTKFHVYSATVICIQIYM